jgi:hypothetical protein
MSAVDPKSQNFWSRRRAAVSAEAQAEIEAAEAEALAADQAALEEKTDEEILAELDLPDPDTLKQGDDFTRFLSKTVPDRIRRRALRKLWLSNPLLANVDGLVDYGEDFTDSALVVENLQTAYQVGKGMLSHVLALEEEAEKNEAEPTAEEDDAAVLALSETPDEADLADSVIAPQETPEQETASAAPPAESDPAPAPRRRMRFAFET